MAARKRKRKEQAPGWAWMLFGLSIGLGVALFVYLESGAPITLLPERSIERSDAPAVARPAPDTSATRTSPTQSAAPPIPAEPAQAADTAADNAADSGEDLGFYDLLRELEVAVPGSERNTDRADRAPGAYRIQAGSFRTDAEADSRQARLALLGIESHVERAIVDNNIWHRVIIGPLTELEEINRILRRLRAERIETLPPQAVPD